jgi:DNA-binding NarL/FixJ family response regulator
MATETNILIADDHPIFREGLRRVIEKQRGWKIVAEAGDGETALHLIKELRPDIALLDVVMPKLNGLGVAREVQRKKLPVAIVFLTMFKESDVFDEAMDLGIKGYMLKDNAVVEIVNCMRSVASGEYFISPAISHLLVKRTERARGLAQEQPRLQNLTPAERRILLLIADGKTSKQIGAELFVSPKTVDNHRFNIAEKLGVRGPNGLLKFALENRPRL